MGLTDYANGVAAQTGLSPSNVATYTESNVSAYINQIASQYVITPKGLKGIAGFVFDYEGEDRLTMESDITDHYAEDNTAIQDHIALRPKMIILRGFVSELTLPGVGTGLFGSLTQLQQKLGTADAYLGKYTPQGLQNLQGSASKAISQVQNYANTASQYLNQAKNLAGLFGVGQPPTQQAKAYQTLGALRDSFQVFGVTTPWSYFPSMSITSLVFMQPKDNKQQSDITVTMKEIRYIDYAAGATSDILQGRAGPLYSVQTASGGSITPVTTSASGLV